MEFLGLRPDTANVPELDGTFVPMAKFFAAHQKEAGQPFAVAVERSGGFVSVYETKVIGTEAGRAADEYYIDRLVKFLLWARGGWHVTLCGDAALADAVKAAYAGDGARAYDAGFMARIYGRPFVVDAVPYAQKPAAREASKPLGGNTAGCRIGFDAGGSDRKVSAVIDGEAVFSEEVVWHPKQNADPDYHYDGIVSAMRAAAAKMPRVDAVGVSSAGVYIDNECRAASLFIKVSEADFDKKVRDIYIRAAKEVAGDVPLAVANDGDVTALAGSLGLGEGRVLGIAMGTSEAAGYTDKDCNITGWLNELAFAPVDAQPDGAFDEWSGDIGCGVKYMSQDAVVRLAPRAGLSLMGETPAEKLAEVQRMMEQGNPAAEKIYRAIGIYLGHSLGLYAMFYDIGHALVLGRVVSGRGGDIIVEEAARVLRAEYPGCAFAPQLPDEKTRRVGQSVAAASL